MTIRWVGLLMFVAGMFAALSRFLVDSGTVLYMARGIDADLCILCGIVALGLANIADAIKAKR